MEPGQRVRIIAGWYAGMTGEYLETSPTGSWSLVRLTSWGRVVSVRPDAIRPETREVSA